MNDKNGPPIMNASLGECEVTPLNPVLNNAALDPVNGNENPSALPVSQGLANSSEPAQTQILRQAVIEGRTLFASSGDSGSSCTAIYPGTNGIGNYGVPLTEDPADNPYTVGVGGTVLYSDGGNPGRAHLRVRVDALGRQRQPVHHGAQLPEGRDQPRPHLHQRPSGGQTNSGQLCRGVPDVAAISGDVISNGYTIVSDGADSEGGGTSLSSPLWAGMWARGRRRLAGPQGRRLRQPHHLRDRQGPEALRGVVLRHHARERTASTRPRRVGITSRVWGAEVERAVEERAGAESSR